MGMGRRSAVARKRRPLGMDFDRFDMDAEGLDIELRSLELDIPDRHAIVAAELGAEDEGCVFVAARVEVDAIDGLGSWRLDLLAHAVADVSSESDQPTAGRVDVRRRKSRRRIASGLCCVRWGRAGGGRGSRERWV